MDLVLLDTRTGKRRPIVLGNDPLVLGSGIECDVIVPSPEVPDAACRVTASAEGIVFESLHPDGFALNEQRTRNAILHPGDVVKLGPFQLVAAGAGPTPAPPPPPPAPPAAALPPASTQRPPAPPSPRARERENAAAVRRAPKAVPIGGAALLLVGALGFLLWREGTLASFFQEAKRAAGIPEPADAPPEGSPSSEREGEPPSTAASGTPGATPPSATADAPRPSSETPKPTDHAAPPAPKRGSTDPADVAGTLKLVDSLLESGEYARCRWLLYKLAPAGDADRARVAKRRKEVDAAAKIGGDEYLALTDRLIENGKLAAALMRCNEQQIANFRGLDVWYSILERGDKVEELLDATGIADALRPQPKRKHARVRPPDLATAPPPPIEPTLLEIGDEAPEPTIVVITPEKSKPAKVEPEPEKPPAPPSSEELAASAAVVAALRELAAARPSGVEAAGRKLGEVARAAKERAVAPLLARCDELAAALDAAPEKPQLADLRKRVAALVEARKAALAFLADEKQYADGDKPQKEADRLVDLVRDLWGSEQGGAPNPQLALSDAYVKLVQETRVIDALLKELGKPPPDHPELLGTRLVPLWAPKLSVRNYALDLEERHRMDADNEIKTRNQQIKEPKDSDALGLLFLANAYREMLGRPQLSFDRKLYDDARAYSDAMAKQAKNAKESDPQPDPTPRVPGSRPQPGANYLRGHFSPRQALQAWLKVPVAHRNLLDAEHRAMGGATVNNYWTLQFGLLAPAVGK
jgi:hypothetical protein